MTVVARIVIGARTFSVELPNPVAEAVQNCDSLSGNYSLNSELARRLTELLRQLLPREKRLPSPQQLQFAQSIAEALHLEVPDSATLTVDGCSSFIDKHQSQFEHFKEVIRPRRNALASTARNLNRWLTANERLEAGESIERVADFLEVKPPTIAKYIASLKEWRKLDQTGDDCRLVMAILERVRKTGEDEYAVAHELVT